MIQLKMTCQRILESETSDELTKRDPYAFGLGKRTEHLRMMKKDPYAFGLGKRSLDDEKTVVGADCIFLKGKIYCSTVEA